MIKYHPYITANGNNLDATNPTFCVGQKVTFELDGLPGYVNLAGTWNLPGNYVNQVTNYSPTCTNYVLNSLLLLNTNQTSGWFYNRPGGQTSIGASLLFNDAQTASIAAKGSITIVKPTIVNFDALHPPIIQAFFNTNNGVETHCDVGWYTQVLPPQSYSGELTCVQLINRYITYSAPYAGICFSKDPDSTYGAYQLDNTYPYALDTPESVAWSDNPAKPFAHTDSPQYEEFCDSIFINDRFETYLRFQPDGGIPITIDRVNWGWNCNATESGGIWTWTTSTNIPTEHRDDDSFPLWEEVYHNRN